jgi:hypothetical protein
MTRIVLVLILTAAFGEFVAEIVVDSLYSAPVSAQSKPCTDLVIGNDGTVVAEIPCTPDRNPDAVCIGANAKEIPCPPLRLR